MSFGSIMYFSTRERLESLGKRVSSLEDSDDNQTQQIQSNKKEIADLYQQVQTLENAMNQHMQNNNNVAILEQSVQVLLTQHLTQSPEITRAHFSGIAGTERHWRQPVSRNGRIH